MSGRQVLSSIAAIPATARQRRRGASRTNQKLDRFRFVGHDGSVVAVDFHRLPPHCPPNGDRMMFKVHSTQYACDCQICAFEQADRRGGGGRCSRHRQRTIRSPFGAARFEAPVWALSVRDLHAAREAGAAEALSREGDSLRSQGQLRQAADVLALLGHRQPDHPRARYLSALLRGFDAPLPAFRPAPWPAAFVRIEDFLDDARHEELTDLLTSPTHTFEPSTVGKIGPQGPEPRVDVAVRVSFQFPEIAPFAEWLRPLIEACLQPVSTRLGLAPFPAAMIELKCTAYGDGGFFRVHSDSRSHPLRRIGFVYYFHQEPKRYTGGALLLYDGDVTDPTRYFQDSFTRLETLDNSIVFFPSGTYHEVTPVASPSGRMEDARFTIAGHVHTFELDSLAASPA